MKCDLGHNNLTSLPSGFFDNNPGLEILDLNDNLISSLDGVGLTALHEVYDLKLHNNRLSQLPSDFVTDFVTDANATPPTKYCLVSSNFGQQPVLRKLDSWRRVERILDRVRFSRPSWFDRLAPSEEDWT